MTQPPPNPTTEYWPLDKFEPDERELARHNDPDAIDRLAENLTARGQIQQVGATADGRMIFGHGRLIAAKRAGLKTLEVKVYPADTPATMFKIIRASENLHRKEVTAPQRLTICLDLLEANPGWKNKDLAEALNLDPGNITRLLAASKCSEAWQAAFRDGKVSISQSYLASRLSSEKQNGLLNLILSGASRDQVERVGRKEESKEPREERPEKPAKGRAKTAGRVNRIECPLPGGRVVLTGKAMGLDDMLALLQGCTAKVQNAKAYNLGPAAAQQMWETEAKAG